MQFQNTKITSSSVQSEMQKSVVFAKPLGLREVICVPKLNEDHGFELRKTRKLHLRGTKIALFSMQSKIQKSVVFAEPLGFR